MIDFKLKKYIILDLDGTLYAGSQLFPYTVEFLQTLRKTGRQPVFLTNNSSKSTDEYFKKLKLLGIARSPEEIYTSGKATIEYLQKKGIKRIYLMAASEMEKEFEEAGFSLAANRLNKPRKEFVSSRTSLRSVRGLRAQSKPEAVVLTFDTTFTYEKFCRAHDLITAGVPFYATHPDNHVPLENGIMHPDIGTFISAFRVSTGKRPFVIGKPKKHIYQQLLEQLGCKKNEMVMIGDRLNTDILGANNYDIDTVLVLSGETTRTMLNKIIMAKWGTKAGKGLNPTAVIENVGELIPLLVRKTGVFTNQ